MPFDLKAGLVFVDVTLNGKGPFPFILDTGATETIVTPPTARELGIRRLAVASHQEKGEASSIAVGRASLRELPVYITDPPQALPLRLDKGIDYRGLLGHTFLKRFIVTIDYPARELRLTPLESTPLGPGVPTEGESIFSAPLRVQGGMLHATCAVNGKGPVTFIVDTGSAEVLLLPSAARGLEVPSIQAAHYPGIRFAQLAQLSLGGATAVNIPAIVHRLDREGMHRLSYHGILGTPFLSNFIVTISYRDRLIVLETPQ